jgi:hypothetical protein
MGRLRGDGVRSDPRISQAAALLLQIGVFIGVQIVPALAFDHGQYADVPPDIRAWFKAVRSPKGVPCCDVADGHRTTWQAGKAGYEVPIDGQWLPVPPDAVIDDAGNPVGEAVVWYTKFSDGKVYIRCFVPGGGV